MSGKIVDFTKARKAKLYQEKVKIINEKVAQITDRMTFRLIDGNILQAIAGDTIIEQRPATSVEIDLINNYVFRDAMMCNVLNQYAPHLMYDDYLSFPYVDWVKAEAVHGANFPYTEINDVLTMRALYPIMVEARNAIGISHPKATLGFIPSERYAYGRDITCNRSPYVFHIEDASWVSDTSLRFNFYPRDKDSDLPKGSAHFEKFATTSDRNKSFALFMAMETDQALFSMMKQCIASIGNGSFGLDT